MPIDFGGRLGDMLGIGNLADGIANDTRSARAQYAELQQRQQEQHQQWEAIRQRQVDQFWRGVYPPNVGVMASGMTSYPDLARYADAQPRPMRVDNKIDCQHVSPDLKKALKEWEDRPKEIKETELGP